MSTPIKTKVLLPRASWADWQSSTRVLNAGELVLAYDGAGKFRLFEGDGKTFAEGVKELKLDASQVVLSGDAEVTLQQAIEDLRDAVGNALSGVDGTGTGVVTGLSEDGNRVVASFTNLSGTQVADGTSFNVITSITQDATGKITSVAGISALTEHQSLEDYYTKSETSSATEIADGLTAAVSEANGYTDGIAEDLSADYVGKISTAKTEAIEAANGYTDTVSSALSADYVGKISTAKTEAIEAANGYTDTVSAAISAAVDASIDAAVEALDVDDEVVASQFVTSVSEADGKISVTRGGVALSDLTDSADIATKDDVNAVSAALSADYVEKIGTAKTEAIEAANEYTDALSTAIDTKLEDFALSADVTALVSEVSAATLDAAKDYTDDEIEELSGTLTAYVEKSTLSIGYDSNAKKIYLSGGTNVSEIDASDFIKDGMLSAATYDPATHNIILTFNTDSGASPISVDVGSLVDTYTVADTDTIDLAMANNEISASIKAGSILPTHLSADAEWIFDCN